MTDLIICRGLPASGKTTWAREWVAEDPAKRARVNKDDLRRSLHDGVYLGRDTEQTINLMRDTMIESLLRKGISVVSDDTNLPQPVAKDLARIGVRAGAMVSVYNLTTVDRETCIERDAGREHAVGREVIERMAKKYLHKVPLPDPVITEAAHSFQQWRPDPKLPWAWVVDIDGTLAIKGDRSPFEWHRVGEDTPNEAVVEVTRRLSQTSPVIVVSGRDIVCLEETVDWLDRHGVPWLSLFMRARDDNRNDAIVKHELFWEEIAPRWNVLAVLDDRNRVVAMWREIGVLCMQVAPGDF